jgi:hypothetical protein
VRITTISAIAVVMLVTIGIGATAQRGSPPSPAADDAAVRTLSPEAGRSEPGKKSDTDYWFDSQIVRLTARYEDATVVTERTNDGVVTAQIADTNGNVAAHLSVRSSILQYAPAAGDPLLAANDSGERPTLDTASRQAYGLWKEGRAQLKWQRGLMRPANATRDLEPLELRTEWAHGLTAHATRKFNANVRVKVKGVDKVFRGEVVSTRLTRDGAVIGSSVWFPAQQTLMWSVGTTKGSLDPEILSASNNGPGGWRFLVNSAWVNLQTIAFQHYSSQPRPLASNGRCGPQPGSGMNIARVVDFFVPTLHANTPGCDWPFVWLNGTGYEPCCNRHDLCFMAFGCNWRTWWMFWTSWRCDTCNLIAFSCFSYGGDTWNPGDA